MPNWKKVIVSGSDAVLNSLNVVTALTASGLNYPTTDGLYSGQVIQTNAAGNLTFGDVNGIYQTIKNGEATSLTVGTAVYVSGSQGANPIVYRADAADPNKMPVQYIIPETITAGAIGRGLLLGILEGYNVGSAAAGTLLWVDGNGTLTTTRPTGSSDTTQPIAIVTKTGAGGQLSVLNPGPILLPNLQTGYTWIGNGNNYPIAVATSSIKNVVSSSYASASTSASYSTNSTTASTASYVTTAQTASFYGGSVTSASYASNATTAQTASFVNLLNQNVTIYGDSGNTGTSNILSAATANGASSRFYIKDNGNYFIGNGGSYSTSGDVSNRTVNEGLSGLSLKNVSSLGSLPSGVRLTPINDEGIHLLTYANGGTTSKIAIGWYDGTGWKSAFDVQNGRTSLQLMKDGGNILIGTTTDLGYKLDVSGSGNFRNNLTITGSASNSLRVKGSGATSATNTLYLENSSNINTFAVADNGNVTVNTGSLTINQATGTGIGIALKAPADYYSPKLEFNAIGGTSRIIQGYGGQLFLEGGSALKVSFGIYNAAGTVSNVDIYTYPYGGSQPAYPNNYSMLIKNPDTTGVNLMIRAAGGQPGTGSVTEWQNSGGTEVVAKITASGSAYFKSDVSASSFTGSLLGTASTASYVVTAQTASFYGGSVTSASYASNATSASYAPGGTVNTGTSAKLAYYPSTGDTVDDAANLEYDGTNLKILSTAQLDFYTDAGSIYFGTFGSPSYGRAGFSVPGQAVMVIDYSNARAGFGGGTSLITSAPAGLVEIQGKTDEIQLLVKGNGTQTNNILEIQKSTGAILYYLDNNGDAKLASGSLGVGIAPNGTDGRIDASNDIVAFSTSDINWKTNIKPIENAIDKVKQISGNTFDWIEDTNPVGKIHGNKGKDIGVIAQEIEKVLPEIVTTRESGTKAVKYEKIVALLIEAIKEQQQQIDELKSKLK